MLERRRCATICAGPLDLWVIERLEFPALTDGAINSRSFGPKSLTSTVIARRDNHFDLSKRQDKNVISLLSFRSFPVRRCRLTHHRADYKVGAIRLSATRSHYVNEYACCQ